MELEVKRIYLYGDGEPGRPFFAWMFCEGDRIVLCDFSEAGAYVAGKMLAHMRSRGVEAGLKVVNAYRVLAENPLAEVVADGPDRMNRIVNDEVKARTAVELLSRLLKRVGGEALDDEPLNPEEGASFCVE